MATEPAERTDTLAAAVTDVSDKLSVLVREEIELAKAEVTTKVSSIARGAAAVAFGAVVGVFALVFVLLSIAWGINAATGSLWLGFVITMGLLLVLTAFAFLFAWRKLKVGAPKPTMALDEAKKIRATVKPGNGA
ncbi:MAG TPA: phage holin family protein [Solirubrobacteraceae bacterium]|nr:phage holin family protein [Solirubrobacteraceae bacterium]